MANITPEQLQHVFRSATTEQIPLFEKRLEVLREAGRVLLERFGTRREAVCCGAMAQAHSVWGAGGD
jgi:hypothetical protein